MWEGRARRLLHRRFVLADEGFEVVGRQFSVEFDAAIILRLLQQVFETAVIDLQHDVAIHLDEAAIAVIGEAGIAGGFRQTFGDRVVHAEVQDGVHHPRHRGARAGPDRDEQRIRRIAETGADDFFDIRQRARDLRVQPIGIDFAIGVIALANLGGDGEARRHRQPDIAHFSQVRALPAEKIAHIGLAFRLAAAETVNPLRHSPDARINRKNTPMRRGTCILRASSAPIGRGRRTRSAFSRAGARYNA